MLSWLAQFFPSTPPPQAETTLDLDWNPEILEGIVAACDLPALLLLRSVSKDLKAVVDARLFTHVVRFGRELHIGPDMGSISWDKGRPWIERQAHMVRVVDDCAGVAYTDFDRARTLRVFRQGERHVLYRNLRTIVYHRPLVESAGGVWADIPISIGDEAHYLPKLSKVVVNFIVPYRCTPYGHVHLPRHLKGPMVKFVIFIIPSASVPDSTGHLPQYRARTLLFSLGYEVGCVLATHIAFKVALVGTELWHRTGIAPKPALKVVDDVDGVEDDGLGQLRNGIRHAFKVMTGHSHAKIERRWPRGVRFFTVDEYCAKVGDKQFRLEWNPQHS